MNKRYFVPMIIVLILVIWMAASSSQAMDIDQIKFDSDLTAGLWYVTPDGDDSNDCSSITSPCATINMVLNKPGFVDGDIVYVSRGVYTATTGSEVVLLNKSVILSGGWDATFTSQVDRSTIDGREMMRGVLITSGVTASIDRFVIQKGTVFQDVGFGIKIWAI